MIKWIETTGRSEEDAIAAALFQLDLDRDDVSVEVIERAKSGFLGFGGNPAKVRVSYEAAEEERSDPISQKPEPDTKVPPARAKSEPLSPKAVRNQKREEAPVTEKSQQMGEAKQPVLAPVAEKEEKAARIQEFLTGLMRHMSVEATPVISVTPEGGYKVVLQGNGLGAIIGHRGETLDAIQQITNHAVNHGEAKRVRIHIDAENYRAKREESLRRLAVKVAGKVVKYRKNVTLEAMNAYERHVIHEALQGYHGVTTYSTGVEPNRRIVVALALEK